jgi:hypothetical protein
MKEMKKLFALLLVLVIFNACKKENNTPNIPATDERPSGSVIATAKIGEGNIPGDKANGEAQIYNDNGTWKLYLFNFSTTNGPDLHVYLATEENAASFIDIGLLKSTTGNQVYNVGSNPNLATYKYIIIWCKQFGVFFGGGQWK